ncbi:hypothetical protein FDJ32_gp09 [Pseudomonas phage NV1]|uniref:Uncharacterized protein n=1 Tax=Pseudomonas phage NV1 TaxID=2079543 RepID=A0A2L0HPK0_9CAUD|nr:hypothetical protein FDJ32_gp09 [Pseudomonas phage NV1]AUX83638.1 hypothetical protein NV1_p09 [Pseudomonas phage NV1]
MAVAQVDYPSCCTGDILIGFGKTNTGDGRSQLNRIGMTHMSLANDVAERMRNARYQGIAFLSCAINSDQVIANQVLRELGWKPSKWLSKRNHPETKVRHWLFHVEDYPEDGPYRPISAREFLQKKKLDKYLKVV